MAVLRVGQPDVVVDQGVEVVEPARVVVSLRDRWSVMVSPVTPSPVTPSPVTPVPVFAVQVHDHVLTLVAGAGRHLMWSAGVIPESRLILGGASVDPGRQAGVGHVQRGGDVGLRPLGPMSPRR